jgi:hypothetical protein
MPISSVHDITRHTALVLKYDRVLWLLISSISCGPLARLFARHDIDAKAHDSLSFGI